MISQRSNSIQQTLEVNLKQRELMSRIAEFYHQATQRSERLIIKITMSTNDKNNNDPLAPPGQGNPAPKKEEEADLVGFKAKIKAQVEKNQHIEDWVDLLVVNKEKLQEEQQISGGNNSKNGPQGGPGGVGPGTGKGKGDGKKKRWKDEVMSPMYAKGI